MSYDHDGLRSLVQQFRLIAQRAQENEVEARATGGYGSKYIEGLDHGEASMAVFAADKLEAELAKLNGEKP